MKLGFMKPGLMRLSVIVPSGIVHSKSQRTERTEP